jgi:protein SCO1/2
VRAAAVVLLALAALGCREREVGLPYFTESTLTPRWLDGEAARGAHRVADFTLVDQQGGTVHGHDLEGRVRVVSFIFTTCGGICPATVGNLKRARRELADRPDVLLLSLTVDPATDDPARLARYGQAVGIEPAGWKLLTGEVDAIYGLARASFFAESKAAAGTRGARDFLHTENVYLVDGGGRLRGVYNGTLPLDVRRLVDDVRRLEAS